MSDSSRGDTNVPLAAAGPVLTLLLRLCGDHDRDAFDAAMTRRFAPLAIAPAERTPLRWLRDRVGLLALALAGPFIMLGWEGFTLDEPVVVLDPAARSAEVRRYRAYYLERFLGVACGFAYRGRRVRAASVADIAQAVRLWAVITLVALRALVDFSWRKYGWIAFGAQQASACVLGKGRIERVYVGHAYDQQMYVATMLLNDLLGMPCAFLTGTTPLHPFFRYAHLRIPIVLSSRAQVPEFEHYRSVGEARYSEPILAGNEFALDFDAIESREPTCDIGYYSSGEWARVGGRIRAEDFEAVRRGAYLDNPLWRSAAEIMEHLAALSRERGWTLVIYPHPLERQLLDAGIEMPYAHLIDGETVRFDRGDASSRMKLYEPRAAVSALSTAIWERIELGLGCSFVYAFPDSGLDIVDPVALGEFAECIFASFDELDARLDACLAGGERS